jgi:histidinol-phosphatase (PHP family)
MIDYHVHTTFSDGLSDFSDYVEEAVKRNVDEIGFSDHIHFKKESWSMSHTDLPAYVSKISSLKRTSPISVKTGLEVDFVPSKMANLMRVIEEFDFDYLLGSVHHVGSWLIDSDREIEEWKRRDVDQVCQQYYVLVQDMARTGLFDIIGHLDLVKKFGFMPKNDLTSLWRETIEAVSKSKMCIEINTSGLRKPCREVYPSERLLRMCFDYGLPLTLGSDAHRPQDVGADFGKAIDLLRKIGYVQIVRFTERKREFVDI